MTFHQFTTLFLLFVIALNVGLYFFTKDIEHLLFATFLLLFRISHQIDDMFVEEDR